MWIDRILESRTTRTVELAALFAEERHRVLANNIANVQTPDFHRRKLDPHAFQRSLGEALDTARARGSDRLDLRGNAQFSTESSGRIEVRPDVEPPENVLFHDGTNAKLERLMADVAENTSYYDLSMNLLRGRYQSLLRAIRGKTA